MIKVERMPFNVFFRYTHHLKLLLRISNLNHLLAEAANKTCNNIVTKHDREKKSVNQNKQRPDSKQNSSKNEKKGLNTLNDGTFIFHGNPHNCSVSCVQDTDRGILLKFYIAFLRIMVTPLNLMSTEYCHELYSAFLVKCYSAFIRIMVTPLKLVSTEYCHEFTYLKLQLLLPSINSIQVCLKSNFTNFDQQYL